MSVQTVKNNQAKVDANGKAQLISNNDARPRYQHYGPRRPRYQCRAQQTTPRLDLIKPGSVIAFDIEGVQLPMEVGSRRRAQAVHLLSTKTCKSSTMCSRTIHATSNTGLLLRDSTSASDTRTSYRKTARVLSKRFSRIWSVSVVVLELWYVMPSSTRPNICVAVTS